MPDDPAKCPFTPPYPTPLKKKAGLLKQLFYGMDGWTHTLFERSYTMKMGERWMPSGKNFTINELSLARRIMEDEAKEYPKHRVLNELVVPLIGNSVFNTNGKVWEAQRQMINPAFQHTNLKRAFPMMMDAVSDLMAMIAAGLSDQPFDIDPMMTHVTADIIIRTLFSVPLSREDSERIYTSFNRYQKLAQRSTMLQQFRLPNFGYRRAAVKESRNIHAVFEPIMRRRYDAHQAGEDGHNIDIMSALMDARHPESGEPFSFQDLIDQVSLIFLAGHETSATSLSWTLYLLAECPDLQEKLLGEIDAITGGETINFEHVRLLDGVRNLFKEGLRLYPPIAFFPREATKPEVMREKKIRIGDILTISPFFIQRNSNNWPCPHSFDPDRFTDPDQAEAVRNAWLPFGRGPRLCIGAGFAQQEAVLILANIIRSYRLAYPNNVKKPEMVGRLTIRPKHGIPLILTPR
jgi:cytochrome P450